MAERFEIVIEDKTESRGTSRRLITPLGRSSMQDKTPTPEEIRAICWEIQSGWSEAERRKRIVCDHTRRALRWVPQGVDVSCDRGGVSRA